MKALLFWLSIISFFIIPQDIYANEIPSRPTMTVINPLRGHQLGLENADLIASLKAQWGITKQQNIAATWLWQYSALEEKELVHFAKTDMKKQEFGVFLEIDRNTAEKAGITYKGKEGWYLSDGLLLVSYDQYDRRKLIDFIFERFKKEFGYYPKTVGAWWVGADAINYMREKYHIVAVLQCADQFHTDAYSLWGTPWSIPYIPSKQNAAIPAQDEWDKQNNVVILQWASRDPLRAYGDSVEESIYSVQDMKFPEIEYYEYLSNIFLQKPYDQTVVGLEGGLPPSSYTINYEKQLQKIKAWEKNKKVIVQTASEYADAYLKRDEVFPPTSAFITKDYKNDNQSFWYHSPYYRIGIQKIKDKIYVVDLRDYRQTRSEDFSVLPNTQGLIRINTKALIDSTSFPEQKRLLATEKQHLQIKTNADKTTLISGTTLIATFSEKNVSLPTVNDSFDFVPQTSFAYPSIFVLVSILCYIVVIFLMTRKRSQFVFSSVYFVLSFLSILPIITSGSFFSENHLLNDQFLYLLSITSIVPLSPSMTIFFAYQLLPLLFVVIFHFLITKKVKNKTTLFAIYATFFIVSIIIVYNLWQPVVALFGQGKRKALMGTTIIIFFVCLSGFLITIYKQRKIRLFITIICVLFLSFSVSNYYPLTKQKTLIITPFEMEVLEEIFKQKKDVIYLSTQETSGTEIDQSISSVLFLNKQIGAWLTKTHWQEVRQNRDKGFSLSDYQNKLIVVPRYQAAEVLEGEMKKYRLKKIFDNAQIAIYTF